MAISQRRRWLQSLAALLLVAMLGWAGVAAVRAWRAAADAQAAQALAPVSTAGALGYLAAALRWRPDDSLLWRQRAELASFAAPTQARAFAQRAVRLNPRDWRAWQTLGLLDYQLGDLAASRRDLREATRYDHGFLSHFTLGNLALAQGNEAEFQREMQAALAVAPLTELDFALRQVLDHAHLAPAQLAALLPADRAEVVARSVDYFVLRGHLAAAMQAWRRLHCQPYQFDECRESALVLANGLAATAFASAQPTSAKPGAAPVKSPELPAVPQLVATAVAVWNRAVRQSDLAQSPAVVGGVSDGQFQHAWRGPAFSWHSTGVLPLQTQQGIAPHGNAVWIPFNGYEPDEAVLLNEFVPVEPGTTYSISYQSRRQAVADQTGLRLVVLAAPDEPLAKLPARLGMAWALNAETFTVPAGIHILQLAFDFVRPNGQVRMHDPVLIADVLLQPIAE